MSSGVIDIIPEDKRFLKHEKEVGFVMKKNFDFDFNNLEDREKSVFLYVPMLMNEIKMGQGATENDYPLNSSIIKNKNFKVKFSSTVKIKNYITAHPVRNSNIEQPPLNIGESVNVEFLDIDIKKPRYTTQGINEKARTNDRFRAFITDKVNKEQDIQEYEMLMDSETQRIRIHMNNGRGETDKYTIEVDGIKGSIRIQDDHKNEFCLITKDKHVYMINQDGTFVEVKETIAKIKADTKIILDTPIVVCTHRLHAIDTITSDAQILDTQGNTNHHIH